MTAILAEAIGGAGCVVNIMGAPGIGKSRLVRESAAIAAGRGVPVFMVTSHIRFGDGTQCMYCWHPDLAHPLNQPHELCTVTTRNGIRKRLIVSAPGHLDAVSEFPGCDRLPRVLGGDKW